jgi:hypothetical protein
MTFSKRFALAALLVSGFAHAQRSAQDIESARQLYNQGIELRDKGDLQGALEKLRAAHALGNTPLTGIELCRTHAALHQPVEAREVCLGVSRIPQLAQETARSQEARAEAVRIAEAEKSKIGGLRIKVTGVPAGAEPIVMVDNAKVPPAALGEPRAVNPGPHQVSARVGSGVETKATIETREGETRDVELIVRPPDPGTAPAEPQRDAPTPGKPPETKEKKEKKASTLATVGLGIGVTGALIGSIAGLVAIGKESSLEDKCTNKLCGQDLHDDLDSARSWASVSTAAFIIAGVAFGAALISYAASPSGSASRTKPKGLNVAFGGTGLYGSF